MNATRARPVNLSHPRLVCAALSLLGILALRALPEAHAAAMRPMQSAATLQARRLAAQTRPQHEVAFNPADFDKFVGDYELSPTAFFHVFRRGDHYFAQLTGQPPVREYPESPTTFFATVVAAQIRFVLDAQGRVTGLVLRQDGIDQTARKVR